jgi:hypothetical protein
MKTYAIVYRRHFYSGTFYADESYHIVDFSTSYDSPEGLNSDGWTFNNKSDAEQALKGYGSRTYYLSHGEYSAPTYKVLSANHSIVKGALNRDSAIY